MSILDQMPPELRQKLREQAKQDLEGIRNNVLELVQEAQKDDSFEAQMGLIAAMLLVHGQRPAILAMVAAEAVFMLAEEMNK